MTSENPLSLTAADRADLRRGFPQRVTQWIALLAWLALLGLAIRAVSGLAVYAAYRLGAGGGGAQIAAEASSTPELRAVTILLIAPLVENLAIIWAAVAPPGLGWKLAAGAALGCLWYLLHGGGLGGAAAALGLSLIFAYCVVRSDRDKPVFLYAKSVTIHALANAVYLL